MTTIYRKYMREIKHWNWDEILKTALNNVTTVEDHLDETNYWVGTTYLGSVLSIAPSGKYYTPWAHSNLSLCPRCKGSGRGVKRYQCPMCEGYKVRIFEEDRMNPDILKRHDYNPNTNTFTCTYCEGTGTVVQNCTLCGGTGSLEAYRDQEFFRALDKVASDQGGVIVNGEGDPTDLFFQILIGETDNE